MLETTVQPGTNIVTLDAHGGITAEEMLHVRAVLDEALRDHDSVRMVATRGELDVGDVSPKAPWLARTSAGCVKKLARLTVVTDVDREAKASEWTSELLHIPTRRLRLDERAAARAWTSRPQLLPPPPAHPTAEAGRGRPGTDRPCSAPGAATTTQVPALDLESPFC
ncbi:hypothetical protein AS188_10535 [Kocuria flava]|uniref:STAS/SEC14 domain-containing protein n=1 Tax=Kocuria flava TaxID=446860 RepID=A0A0U3HG27_9MICC|nr:STAS/SEC14 domain-containing protein [Kocuria flava]ALU40105.1 hypothetical protein AS188_10535 [Kocuria flava]GEO91060.1 hypothetical protein KFL01_03660 [Kocuria flava]